MPDGRSPWRRRGGDPVEQGTGVFRAEAGRPAEGDCHQDGTEADQ